MEQMKFAKGESGDFAALIESGCFYVDKTRFLRQLLLDTGWISLFTRPRRFGKSTTLTMVRDFLELDYASPGNAVRQQRLFNGLAVMRDCLLCEKFMGQFPVIHITLKGASGSTFKEALDKIACAVSDAAGRYKFLQGSPRLDERDKRKFNRLLDMEEGLGDTPQLALERAVQTISTLLFKHFCRQVVVLIDEYDVPLAKAQQKGFHSEMASFYTGFFQFLKSENWEVQEIPVAKIIMTGCLRVAKNQVFTGANNFHPYTVVSDNPLFPALFGFTQKETADYLAAFGLSEYMGLVKDNYDGYRVLNQELFCPWDVCNFVNDSKLLLDSGLKDMIKAKNYWAGSESTNTTAIKDYVGTLREEDTQRLQELSDGGEVEVGINDNMNYDCLDRKVASDMWSLLLHTGYLTAIRVISGDRCVVKIPNKEIKECFDDSILESFKEAVRAGGEESDLGLAIVKADADKVEKIIKGTLASYVECRYKATSSPRENFYSGYMLGTLSCSKAVSGLKLEKQSGLGFADLIFTRAGGSDKVVLELKVAPSGNSVRASAKKAIEQIIDRQYARQYVENDTIGNVLAVGIAFYDRGACVDFKVLKGSFGKAAESR